MKNIIFFFGLLTTLLFIGCDDTGEITIGDTPTVIDSDINELTTLTDVFSDPGIPDYRVVDTDWRINAGLIIEPGVIIEFDAGVLMRVHYNGGYLIADGTSTQPIILTGIVATPGFWKGILINSEDTRNLLNNCVVEYGGGGELEYVIPSANIGVIDFAGSKGTLNITNTTIRNSMAYGLVTDDGATLLSFTNNTFSNITNAALQLSANEVSVLDNSTDYGSDNGYNGVEVLGGILEKTTTQTWNNLNGLATYKLIGDLRVNSGLALLPNTTLQMDASVLVRVAFDGFLDATGTATSPITIEGVTTAPGFWKGILFNSENTNNNLQYCHVSDAGGGELEYVTSDACIGVIDFAGSAGKVNISNCEISNSAACGISKNDGAQLTQMNNTFTAIALDNICE